MNQDLKDYIISLIPRNYPKGKELLKEGREMAKKIPWNKNRFLKENGFDTWEEYCWECRKNKKEVFTILMGLPTLEEQIDGLKKIEDFSNRISAEVRSVQMIPNQICGIPLEYWDDFPAKTSYILKDEKDWKKHSDAASIDVCFEDWHLSSPNNLKTTEYALKAGTSRMGSFGQFIWEYPGWKDEEKQLSDMCRSMGILSVYKEQGMTVASYPEDGIAGYFMDIASMVGYVMLEHYIIEDLCDARMALSYGGLLSELVPRMAFGLACQRLYGSENKQFITCYNGSTNKAWDHDIEYNYGLGAVEMLIQSIMNIKYNLPIAHRPVSITEAIRVPTLEELLNITKCGMGAISKAEELIQIIDFEKIEKMSDLLIEKGMEFYNNILNGFSEAGVNIEDPLQLLTILKRINPTRLETDFHPSVQINGTFKAYVRTVLYDQTIEMINLEIKNLRQKGYSTSIFKGKKIICVSADGHSYGLLLITKIWEEMGALVISGGVYIEPIEALDLADEENTNLIAISVHTGHILDYAEQIVRLAKYRNKIYRIAFGGILNTQIEGHSEPIDVADIVNKLGVLASNDFEKQLNYFNNNSQE